MKKLMLCMLFLLSLTFVLAQPPTQISESALCDIAYPQYEYAKQNTDFNLHIHVHDTFQGLPITNSTLVCRIDIYGPMGNELVEFIPFNGQATGYDFQTTILGGNFSTLGVYAFHIYCNGTITDNTVTPSKNYLGGCFANGVFEVTYTGDVLTDSQTYLYITILLFLVGLMIYLIYLYPKLPKNMVDSDGFVINASMLSVLRPIILGFLWILTLSITFIISNMAIAYISAGFLGNFLFGLWRIMMYSNLVILPICVVYTITEAFRTAKLKEFLERGGNTNF